MPVEEEADPWRRLQCPTCQYDMRGLPDDHRCPECGFAPPDDSLVIRGWYMPSEIPGHWPGIIYRWFWLMYVLIGPAIGLIVLSVFGKLPYVGALVIVGVVSAVIFAIRRRGKSRLTDYSLLLFINSHGIVLQSKGAKGGFLTPWTDMRWVRLKPVAKGLFKLGWATRKMPRWLSVVLEFDCYISGSERQVVQLAVRLKQHAALRSWDS